MQAGYAFPQVRKAYCELYAKRANLFHDLEPLAQVGLVFLYNQSMLENAEHLKLAYAVKDALGREHFLWDALTEEDIAGARLKRYRVVLVPDGIVLEDEILAALRAHEAGGGVVEWLKEMPARLADVIEKRAGKNLAWTDSTAHSQLRANVYWKAEGGQARVVTHLLNYGEAPERDVTVSIPLPGEAGWKLRSLAAITPMTGQETALAGNLGDGRLTFQMPEVRVHSLVEAVAVK